MDETGWLIERYVNGRHAWIGVERGVFEWTDDSWKALRLSRRKDAEDLSRMIGMSCDRIVEHRWSGS